MQFRTKQIAPPKEWGTFEDLCHALFKRVWQDPLAQKNGRRGQAQHGVDVFGSPNGDRRSYRGVQCKGKDSNYGSKAEWSEVLAEVAKAEKFSPKLDEWIFSTTAPADAILQKAARELSVERRAKGLFSIDVLGWEEIQALMANAPEVIAEFYPEHADHLPQVIETLRALPSLEAKLASLVERIDEKLLEPSNPHGSAVWETVTFDGDRGLGPALMGYPLGPSDAAACPRLTEVGTVLMQLNIAYSARLIGEPGAGKSICSYQAARDLAADGLEVLRLLDPQADNIGLEAALPGKNRLYLIDDAHLLKPNILSRIEEQAGPARLGRGLKFCPYSDGDDLNGGEEVDGMLFEAGCDPAGVLELVEEAFDEIALPVEDLAVAPRHASAPGRWDAGPDAPLSQALAEPVGVIGLVAEEATIGWEHVDQGGNGREVMRLSWGQGQADRQPAAIDHGVDLGGQAAARAPDRFFAVFLGAAAC